MPTLDVLTAFKNFLADRPEWAFLAISMSTNFWLLRRLLAEKDSHFATVERWLRATEQLAQLMSKTVTKSKPPKRSVTLDQIPVAQLPEGGTKDG